MGAEVLPLAKNWDFTHPGGKFAIHSVANKLKAELAAALATATAKDLCYSVV